MRTELTFITPAAGDMDSLRKADVLPPFSEDVCQFLGALSQRLLSDSRCRNFSELVALGFWLRRTNITQFEKTVSGIHKPLGMVVHFTPANVDTMFIYSWVCSVLMGNKNIVRVASRPSLLRDILFALLNELFALPDYQRIAVANAFVHYEKHSEWTHALSEHADARVVWGGDEAVSAIRAVNCQPRCRDISFADRYSAAVINGDALSDESQIEDLSQKLWRDSHPYAQQACSSPRILLWLGSDAKRLTVFKRLETLASAADKSTITQRTNHLALSQLLCSESFANKSLYEGQVSAILVNQLRSELLQWHTGEGIFYVIELTTLTDILKYADEKLQTLSYWGVAKTDLSRLVSDPAIKGIDRVVPLGQALAFEPVWDGYELFSQLSRRVILE